MALVVTSKQAGYGDDMRRLQQGTIDAVNTVKLNMQSFTTLRDAIEADNDMGPQDLTEIENLIDTGYTYIWNQIKNVIVPEEYQTP